MNRYRIGIYQYMYFGIPFGYITSVYYYNTSCARALQDARQDYPGYHLTCKKVRDE